MIGTGMPSLGSPSALNSFSVDNYIVHHHYDQQDESEFC